MWAWRTVCIALEAEHPPLEYVDLTRIAGLVAAAVCVQGFRTPNLDKRPARPRAAARMQRQSCFTQVVS